jgi:hypothetical protein
LPLYGDDFHNPFWIEHPDRHAKSIDIAALALPSDMPWAAINLPKIEPIIEMVGSDLAVIGYPFGLSSKGQLPIWKRGSIATEPALPWNGLEAMLLDCRTSAGMSGSPVFLQVLGPVALEDKTIKADAIRTVKLIGIYSGRLKDDENVASIGIVWRRIYIDTMFENPAKGSRG